MRSNGEVLINRPVKDGFGVGEGGSEILSPCGYNELAKLLKSEML